MNETPNAIDRSQMLSLGAVLQGGKYRIERYLSSGGFGNTYVVVNTVFEERYAMKEFFMKGISERESDSTTVSVSNSSNKEQFSSQKDKFKKEAQRLRRLRDAHLVFVHDFFEENGTAYYVMDYVEGESLSTLLKRRGVPFGEDEALGIFRQVLDALRVVHEKKIWHLDLKPGNIILDKSGRAVVIDFGASKQLSGVGGYTTTTTSMCYTPGYAPSEQIDQKMERIGPWTDLYALGGTLYNMLTLHTPPTVSEVIDGDAFSFPADISEKTRRLICWMMQPGIMLRPQSVSDVEAFLDRPFTGEDTSSAQGEETVLGVKPATRAADRQGMAGDIQETQQKTSLVSPLTPWYRKKWLLGVVVSILILSSCLVFYLLNTKSSSHEAMSQAASDSISSVNENPNNGPIAVDLGLPSGTKWADRNVGADKPEDYGDYFAWGETAPKSDYSWSTYKWGKDYDKLTKYCNDSSLGLNGFTDTLTELVSGDDAASVNWGGDWRMPTSEEISELINNTNSEWVTNYNGTGKNGYKFTNKSDASKHIFLPAAGYRDDTSSYYVGSLGYYWSSSLSTSDPGDAYGLDFDSDGVDLGSSRGNGHSVRPVRR